MDDSGRFFFRNEGTEKGRVTNIVKCIQMDITIEQFSEKFSHSMLSAMT